MRATDITLNYQRKVIGGGNLTTVSWTPTRKNEELMLLMHYRIDKYLTKTFCNTQAFYGVAYFLNMLDEYCRSKVSIGRISTKYNGEKYITLRTYIDYHLLKAADELDSDTFVAFHEILLLDAIIAASKKYKIPEENYKELVERRSKLGQIPEWIPEMENNSQLVIDKYKESVRK